MEIVIGIVGLIVGAIISFVVAKSTFQKSNQKQIAEIEAVNDERRKAAEQEAQKILARAEKDAEKIVSKAEASNEKIKQRKIKEAKDKFSALKSDYDTYKSKRQVEIKEREIEIKNLEKELKRKEEGLKGKYDDLEAERGEIEAKEVELKSERETLEQQQKALAKRKKEMDRANEERIKALENIARLTESEAREQIMEAVKAKSETDAMSMRKNIVEQAKISANKDAKKIIIQSIQRMSAEYTIENTVSVFPLDSDDLKGQIIGREGRNIRALEAATGAEIVVDDTPEAIIISSFDPIRREVCRLSLKRLVGRFE